MPTGSPASRETRGWAQVPGGPSTPRAPQGRALPAASTASPTPLSCGGRSGEPAERSRQTAPLPPRRPGGGNPRLFQNSPPPHELPAQPPRRASPQPRSAPYLRRRASAASGERSPAAPRQAAPLRRRPGLRSRGPAFSPRPTANGRRWGSARRGEGGWGGRPRPLAGRRPMAERGKRRRAEQGAARGRAGRGGARRAGSAVGCSMFSGAASRRPRPSAAVRGPARAVRPFRRLWAFPAASPRAAPRQRWGWRPGGDTPGASLAVAVSPRWLLCRGPPSAPPACRWREGGGTGEQRPWAFLGGCPQPVAWERRALALAWCCKTVPTCPGLR